MAEKGKCSSCGSPLSDSVRGGLCPACLLKRGLQTNTAGFTADDRPGARWRPPTLEQLAPLFPELDIIELIGRGGMGAVYKAREKQLDRLVALKILPPEIGSDAAFAQRFAREAQAMARLNHPNIVTIYSFGQRGAGVSPASDEAISASQDKQDREQDARGTRGQDALATLYFFIMEYVDGLSLRQVLDAGTISSKEALAIVPQICDALQYAHDRGIVHRDIKPENILLNRTGQVKIADFGLATLVGGQPADALAASEKIMGTPQYMAPEQVERPRDVDHRADIYSLGVVFYQMLTGELPKGPEQFEPPSRKVIIDVRLDEVVLRALEKEPSRRYQQASEVRTQVETIVTDMNASGAPGEQPRKGTMQLNAELEFGKSRRGVNLNKSLILVGSRNGKAVVNWGIVWLLALAVFGFLILVVWGINKSFRLDFEPILTSLVLTVLAFAVWIFQAKRTPLEQLTPLEAPTGSSGSDGGAGQSSAPDNLPPSREDSRFSRVAIVGAAWAPFAFIAFVLWFFASWQVSVPKGSAPPSPSAFQILMGVLLGGLGLTAPFGTTICGAISISQIRRSAGRIYGLGLALFDALLFPLLILDGLIALGCYFGLHEAFDYRGPIQTVGGGELQAIRYFSDGWVALVVLAIVIPLNWFIIGRAWRAAKRPIGQTADQLSQPNPSQPPVSSPEITAQIDRARQAVKPPAIGIVFGAVINIVVLLAAKAFLLMKGGGVIAGRMSLAVDLWWSLTVAAALAGIIINILILQGAMRMLHLRNRGLAVAAAILAMLAVPGNIIGLPMGIWALVVLSRRDVIEAFHANERGKTMGKSRAVMWVLLGVILLAAVSVSVAISGHGVDAKKALADKEMLVPKLNSIDRAWKKTQPRTEAEAADYHVQLAIDLDSGVIELQDGGAALDRLVLPTGYEWRAYQTTPGGTRQLSSPVVLRLPGLKDEPAPVSEVFTVVGDMGDGQTGLHFDFAMLWGPGIGTGVPARMTVQPAPKAPTGPSMLVTSPASEPKSRPGDDRETVKKLALDYLKAIKADDIESLKALSAGSVEGWLDVTSPAATQASSPKRLMGWSVDVLKKNAAEFRREVLADYPQMGDEVVETVIAGDFAATASPSVKVGNSQSYVKMVFIRTARGWRFATMDDAQGSLSDELAKVQPALVQGLKALRPTSGPATQTSTASAPETKWREVLLQDADTKGVATILDLASGEMLAPPEGREGQNVADYFNRLEKGDLAFDRVLIIMRGGKFRYLDGKEISSLGTKFDMSAYDLQNLQQEFLAVTADGKSYRLKVVEVTDKGSIKIMFAPATRPASGPAATTAADSSAVSKLALEVLKVIKDDNLDSLKALSAGSVEGWMDVSSMAATQAAPRSNCLIGWSIEALKRAADEIRRDVLANYPEMGNQVVETLVAGDFAATRSPSIKTDKSEKYLILVFTRTNGGWRFATLHDAKGTLKDELAKHQRDVTDSLKAVRSLSPQTQPKYQISQAELKDNFAIDLDTGEILALKKDWPETHELAWDNNAGGVLMIAPESKARILALPDAPELNDTVIARITSPTPPDIRKLLAESKERGVPAKKSRFSAVLTSEGKLAIVEVASFTPAKAQLRWAVISANGVPTSASAPATKASGTSPAKGGAKLLLTRSYPSDSSAQAPYFQVTVRNDGDKELVLNSIDFQFHCVDSAGNSYKTPLPATTSVLSDKRVAPGAEQLFLSTGCGGNGRFYSGFGPREGGFTIWATGPGGLESNRIRLDLPTTSPAQPTTGTAPASATSSAAASPDEKARRSLADRLKTLANVSAEYRIVHKSIASDKPVDTPQLKVQGRWDEEFSFLDGKALYRRTMTEFAKSDGLGETAEFTMAFPGDQTEILSRFVAQAKGRGSIDQVIALPDHYLVDLAAGLRLHKDSRWLTQTGLAAVKVDQNNAEKIVLSLIDNEKRKHQWVLDPKEGNALKEYNVIMPDGSVNISIVSTDFENCGGVMLPHKITQTVRAPLDGKTMTTEIIEGVVAAWHVGDAKNTDARYHIAWPEGTVVEDRLNKISYTSRDGKLTSLKQAQTQP